MDKSMRERGQVNPILIRRTGTHRYRLIDGLQRIQSLKRVGQTTVFAVILSKDNEREEGTHEIPILQIAMRREWSPEFPPQKTVQRVTRKQLAGHLRSLIRRNPKSSLDEIAERVNRSAAWLRKLLREHPV